MREQTNTFMKKLLGHPRDHRNLIYIAIAEVPHGSRGLDLSQRVNINHTTLLPPEITPKTICETIKNTTAIPVYIHNARHTHFTAPYWIAASASSGIMDEARVQLFHGLKVIASDIRETFPQWIIRRLGLIDGLRELTLLIFLMETRDANKNATSNTVVKIEKLRSALGAQNTYTTSADFRRNCVERPIQQLQEKVPELSVTVEIERADRNSQVIDAFRFEITLKERAL